MKDKDGSNMPSGEGTPPEQTQEQTDEDDREERLIIESLQSRTAVESLQRLMNVIPTLHTSLESGSINSNENIMRILEATVSYVHSITMSNASLQSIIDLSATDTQNRFATFSNHLHQFQFMSSELLNEVNALRDCLNSVIERQGELENGEHQEEEEEMEDGSTQEDEIDEEDVPRGGQ